MEFEYTGIIFIDDNDLTNMAIRVINGEDFCKVYNEVMSNYFVTDDIYPKVEKEIWRRIKNKEW